MYVNVEFIAREDCMKKIKYIYHKRARKKAVSKGLEHR